MSHAHGARGGADAWETPDAHTDCYEHGGAQDEHTRAADRCSDEHAEAGFRQ